MPESAHSLEYIEQDASGFAAQLSDPQESADEQQIVREAFSKMKDGDIHRAYADAMKDPTMYYVKSKQPVGWVLKSVLVRYVNVFAGLERTTQESAA